MREERVCDDDVRTSIGTSTTTPIQRTIKTVDDDNGCVNSDGNGCYVNGYPVVDFEGSNLVISIVEISLTTDSIEDHIEEEYVEEYYVEDQNEAQTKNRLSRL